MEKIFDQVYVQLHGILEQLLLWNTMNKLCLHPIKSEGMILRKTSFTGPAPLMYSGNDFINAVSHTTHIHMDKNTFLKIHGIKRV